MSPNQEPYHENLISKNPRPPKRARIEFPDSENLQKIIYSQNLEIQSLKLKIQLLESQNSNLQNSLDSESQKVESHQNLLESQNRKVESLESEVHEFKNLLESQNLKIQTSKNALLDLHKLLKDSESSRKKMGSKIRKMESTTRNWLRLKAIARDTVERKDEQLEKLDKKSKSKFEELKTHYKKKQERLVLEIQNLKESLIIAHHKNNIISHCSS